jgi:dTDP-4-amino-4,6-dideoxygalactose transaminase
MTVPFLDLKLQYQSVKTELDAAIQRVVSSQGFVLGPEVQALEEEVASYLDVPHAIGVASGTDALLLPLRALDPKPGDEVVLPAFTFFATAGAAFNAGFTPVFCDVDPETFNVTAETLDAVWTPRTRAVIPVHLFGQMAPMGEIRALASERRAFVLEDAAQAIGSRIGEEKAGAIGDAGAFSFFPTKNLGGFGDGGMVTTRDDDLADKVAKLRVHGGRQMYHHEMVGTNSRLDAIQAAVLRVKLKYLDEWGEGRRRNGAIYDEVLAGVEGVRTPVALPEHYHVYNQYTLRVDRRDELRAFLNQRGIGSGVYYPLGLHLQPCFAAFGGREGDLPVTEALTREVISLPIFPELSEEQVSEVAAGVREFFLP